MRISFLLALTTALATAACGQADWGKRWLGGTDHGALVKSLETKTVAVPALLDAAGSERLRTADARATAGGATAATSAVNGEVTFKKARLFDRDFLYGFDLQYSSGSDSTLDLIPQSQALGHIPATFRRVGNELQLVADQSRLYESVVNHPEALLATYKITGETDAELTVVFESGGLWLNQVVNGPVSNGPGTPVPAAPQQVWVRSLTYVEDGDYLLQETGLLLADGSVQTYMESVFPRADLVPQGYVGLEGNTQYEPLAARYRFLTAENVFTEKPSAPGSATPTVRLKDSYVTRIDLESDVGKVKTIDWYVTPNIPDKFLTVIKSGVEGWNRYFSRDLGRDVMRFAGKLPAGVKIGDPRYNVINFDSVAQAGAAYESQAVDPTTGIQSHSLIYMPLAWYNIGAQLWAQRTDTNYPTAQALQAKLAPKDAASLFGLGHHVLACVQSPDDVMLPASTLISGIKASMPPIPGGNLPEPSDIDEFSQRLMMSTLFHEVGHSLGLDHQFKGSLAFDGTKPAGPDNPTTYSVMDYNDYQNEMDLFGAIGTSDGPLLEYDRQAISQLYNKGAAVKPTDKVIPACNDAEADATVNGADPLCVRYDDESDPSLSVQHAWANFTATTGSFGTEPKTLPQMLGELAPVAQSTFSDATKIPNAAALQKAATDFGNKTGQVVNYFLAASHQSVRGNLLAEVYALRLWQDGVAVTDEAAFRSRYVQVLKDTLALTALPAGPQAGIDAVAATLVKAAQANASVGADDASRAAAATAAGKAFSAAVQAKFALSLTKVRTDVLKTLAFNAKNDFALALAPGGALSHFEELAPSLVAEAVLRGLDTQAGSAALATEPERLAAAATLATFAGVSDQLDATTTHLKAVLARGQQSGDARLVGIARELIKALGAGS